MKKKYINPFVFINIYTFITYTYIIYHVCICIFSVCVFFKSILYDTFLYLYDLVIKHIVCCLLIAGQQMWLKYSLTILYLLLV